MLALVPVGRGYQLAIDQTWAAANQITDRGVTVSSIVLVLGPIAFRDFEVPSNINFGGLQRLAVHRLTGGQRVIDALGPDDSSICFSGVFSGPEATARAQLLDELRTTGSALPLIWYVFYYTVVINQFQASYQNPSWIPYRLVCSVLRDEAAAIIQVAESVIGSVMNDVAAASAGLVGSGIDLTGLGALMSAAGVTTPGTQANGSAQLSLAGIRSSVDSQLSLAESRVSDGARLGGTAADAAVANFSSATAASQQLAFDLVPSNPYHRSQLSHCYSRLVHWGNLCGDRALVATALYIRSGLRQARNLDAERA